MNTPSITGIAKSFSINSTNTKDNGLTKLESNQRWIVDCQDHMVLIVYNPNRRELKLTDIWAIDKKLGNELSIDLSMVEISPYSAIVQLFGFGNKIAEII